MAEADLESPTSRSHFCQRQRITQGNVPFGFGIKNELVNEKVVNKKSRSKNSFPFEVKRIVRVSAGFVNKVQDPQEENV